jgi:hypothetical protein
MLTDHDKNALREMAAIPCETPTCPCTDWKATLADEMRRVAPGVADEQLAALMLRASGLLGLIAIGHNLKASAVTGIMAGAAVELAALEIGGTS